MVTTRILFSLRFLSYFVLLLSKHISFRFLHFISSYFRSKWCTSIIFQKELFWMFFGKEFNLQQLPDSPFGSSYINRLSLNLLQKHGQTTLSRTVYPPFPLSAPLVDIIHYTPLQCVQSTSNVFVSSSFWRVDVRCLYSVLGKKC